MNFEPEKQRITIDRRTGAESSQLLLEGDILAPDVKPDIMHILKVDTKANIERIEAGTDRVSYQGKLELNILYVSKDSERPVNYMTGVIAIDDFINIDGLTPEMSADIEAEISHIDYRLVNDRKINVKAVIDTMASAGCAVEKEIVCGIDGIPETQVQKAPLKISKIVENKTDKFIIKEELAVPSGKPNIREILNCRVEIANKEVRAQDAKVSVKGDIVVRTLYTGDMEAAPCEYMEHEIPFSGFIDAPGCYDGLFAEATLKISDHYVQIRQDSDGEDRAIEVEISVSAKLRVYAESSVDMLEDAYCINKRIVLTKDAVKYPKVICRNKNQFSVRETIVFPENAPKILQVFSVYGGCKVDRIEIEDEKVVIEGIVAATVLYIDESDANPVSSHDAVIPFRQLLDAKGADDGMNASVEYCISHSSFSMLSASEIEARFVLDASVTVSDDNEIELVTDAVIEDADREYIEAIPSLVVYIVQEGDSLWKIAKRYNTSIDDLLALNEIEPGYKIYPGQKLIIMKKRVE